MISVYLDPAEVERKLTPRTRAIMVVHLFGKSAELRPILELGRKRSIPAIEDTAQSFGASTRAKGSSRNPVRP